MVRFLRLPRPNKLGNQFKEYIFHSNTDEKEEETKILFASKFNK